MNKITNNEWVPFIGGTSCLATIYNSIRDIGWWAAAVIVAGIVGSFILLTALKTWSAFISIVLIVLGYIFVFSYYMS